MTEEMGAFSWKGLTAEECLAEIKNRQDAQAEDAINAVNVKIEAANKLRDSLKTLTIPSDFTKEEGRAIKSAIENKKNFSKLNSAIDTLDGTRSAKQAANARKGYDLKTRKPKGSKLDKHREKIIQLINDGGSLDSISSDVNCSLRTIKRWLKANGISKNKK